MWSEIKIGSEVSHPIHGLLNLTQNLVLHVKIVIIQDVKWLIKVLYVLYKVNVNGGDYFAILFC